MTARLGALVVLLALGAAAAFGLLALRDAERAVGLASAQAAAEQAETVYAAASAAMRERDLTYVALMQYPAKAAAMRPLIAGARAAAELPAALVRGSADWPLGEIDASRTQVDAALAAAGTPQAEALGGSWMAAATARAERLLRLADALAIGATEGSDLSPPLQRARRATAHLAERFGYDRALLAGAALTGRPLTQGQNAERALAAAGVALALREVAALRDAAVLPEAGRAAMERMWASLDGGFEALRSAMAAAARGEGGYPAAAELWLERSAAVLNDVDRAGAALGRVSAERIVSARSAYRGEAAIHATLALMALVLGALALMSRRTSPPVPVQALPAPMEPPAKDQAAAAFAAAAVSALHGLDTARRRAADAATLASERIVAACAALADTGGTVTAGGADDSACIQAMRSIAEHARLLGLNAALESTRALETGSPIPSFAVSARDLADRIGTLVDELERTRVDPAHGNSAIPRDRAIAAANGDVGEAVVAAESAMRAVVEAMDDLRIAGETVAERLQALGRHFDEAG